MKSENKTWKEITSEVGASKKDCQNRFKELTKGEKGNEQGKDKEVSEKKQKDKNKPEENKEKQKQKGKSEGEEKRPADQAWEDLLRDMEEENEARATGRDFDYAKLFERLDDIDGSKKKTPIDL